jgi:hypothetical protein
VIVDEHQVGQYQVAEDPPGPFGHAAGYSGSTAGSTSRTLRTPRSWPPS